MESQYKPLTFTIRPLTMGLNTTKQPNRINERESSDLSNVRFERGNVQFRTGFRRKYYGMAEILMWLDLIYSATEAQVLGFGHKNIYIADSDTLMPIDFFDPDISTSGPISKPYYSMDPLTQYLSIDVGFGQYDFEVANGGALFPSSQNYETLTVMCNGNASNNGGIVVCAYTEAGPQAERARQAGAPAMGRSVAVWAGRLFVGGNSDADGAFQDNARVTWTAKGLLSDWSSGGSTILGDSPDWIQAMRKLGEYLIVYKERSIFIGRETYLNSPPVRFDPAPGQGIGLAAPNSIGDLGEEHIFLGWDNVYMFSLQRIEAVGEQIKDELFYGKNGVSPEYLGNCTGIIAEEFDEYWLFVPSGKWPTREGDTIDVVNLHPDPLCADHGSWVGTDATLSSIAGNIGAEAIQVTQSTGVAGRIHYDVGTLPAGTYSVTVWVRADSDCNRTFVIADTSSGWIASKTISITTTYKRYVINFTISSSASIREMILSGTADDIDFYIDATHVIRIDDVEDKYILNVDGQKTVGYIGPVDEPVEIPIVADRVGPWLPDTCWVYNYASNAWSMWRIPMTGFGYDTILAITTIEDLEGTIEEQAWRYDEKRITEFAPTNLLAQPDGQVYEMMKGVVHDFEGTLNTPFMGYWVSKDFDLRRPDIEKTASTFTLHHEPTHAPTTITVGVSVDAGVNWEDQTVEIQGGTNFTDVNTFVTGPQVRFRIRGITPGFFITGISVKMIPRGETHRY